MKRPVSNGSLIKRLVQDWVILKSVLLSFRCIDAQAVGWLSVIGDAPPPPSLLRAAPAVYPVFSAARVAHFDLNCAGPDPAVTRSRAASRTVHRLASVPQDSITRSIDRKPIGMV